VPLQHSNLSGPVIQLGVVILHATGKSPAPDPLFMAQGGPGGSTIDIYLPLLKDSPIRQQRDIVLFDQRGTAHTKPNLQCTEVNDLLLRTVEMDVPDAESDKQNFDATQACKLRLQKDGVNLSAYDSVENAADVDTLRTALGYDQINLYGVSYGTLLAQHVMRNFPNTLRSVVLDGVVVPRTSFVAEAGRTENRSLSELFSTCKAEPKCNTAYPNLEKTYYDTAARWQQSPAHVPMVDTDNGKTYNVVVNGDTLEGLVFQALYATELLPYLPYIIDEASKGNTTPLGNIGGLFIFEQSVSYGMYYSVTCAEDSNFDPNAVDNSGVRADIIRRQKRDLQQLKAVCNMWKVDPLPPSADEPVKSDVPTLLLSGQFDPITPAPNAEDVARSLSNATTFVFPNTGHGAFQSEKCASRIVAAFITDPAVKPDGSCIAGLKPPQFQTQADIISLPLLLKLLDASPSVRLPLALAGIGLLLLLSAWLVIPLSWLIRLVTNRNGGTLSLAAKAMPWLTLLNALVLAAFVGVLFVLGVRMAQDNDYLVLFGMPASSRPLFMLPVVSILLAVLIVVGTLSGLRSDGWGTVRKINRTILALASIATLIGLALLGMLITPLFS